MRKGVLKELDFSSTRLLLVPFFYEEFESTSDIRVYLSKFQESSKECLEWLIKWNFDWV